MSTARNPSARAVPVLWLIAEVAAALVLTGLLSAGLQRWLSTANLAFLFLMAVSIMAARRGLAGGLTTAVLATLTFNYFFIPPTFTLEVAHPDNLFTLLALVLTAIVFSHSAARLRTQAQQAEFDSEGNIWLAQFASQLADCRDSGAIHALAETALAKWSDAEVKLLDPAKEEGETALETAAMRWAVAHGVPAGRGADVLAGADALYLLLSGAEHPLVARFHRRDGAVPLPREKFSFAEKALARSGLALNRATIERAKEREAVREAILASIGHDLRTPLTSVLAGLASLPDDPGGIITATRSQAAELEMLISNLLELARLRAEPGAVELEATDLTDSIDAAVRYMASRLTQHRLAINIAPDLPMVNSDPRMLHHILLNLLDNAAKFSAPGTLIEVSATGGNWGTIITVSDEGRGLPDNHGITLPRRSREESAHGSGLGMAVIDGFARALGVKVTATNRAGGGAGSVFSVSFPPNLICSTSRAQ